jgi:cell shape-determining protein MreD
MTAAFNVPLAVLGRCFDLLSLSIMGVPIFVFPIAAFLFTMLAKFIHGRK